MKNNIWNLKSIRELLITYKTFINKMEERHPYFKRDAVEVTMTVEIEEVVVEDLKNEVMVEEPLFMPENYY